MGQGPGKKENPPHVVQMKILQCKGYLRVKEGSKKDGEAQGTLLSLGLRG